MIDTMHFLARRWRNWLGPLLVLVLTLAVFGSSIGFNFIEYDDHIHIYENPGIAALDLDHLRRIWFDPSIRMYIPVMETFWALLAALARFEAPPLDFDALTYGLKPIVFHSASLVLHLVNVALLMLFLRRIGICWRASSIAGALFAIHPVQVEAVAWLSAARDLLSTLFCLAVLVMLPRFAKAKRWHDFMLMTILYVLAVLTKPAAVSLPLVAVLIVLLVRYLAQPGITSIPLQRQELLLFSCWILFALPIIVLTRGLDSGASLYFTTAWHEKLLLAFDTITFYLKQILWLEGTGGISSRTPAMIISTGWISTMAIIPILITLILALSKIRTIFLCIWFMFLAALLPVLGLFSFSYQNISTTADRYLYFPMLFVAVALALSMRKFFSSARTRNTQGLDKLRQNTVLVAAIAIILMLAIRAHGLVGHWRDTFTFYEYALKKEEQHDSSWIAHYGYAAALLKRQQLSAAKEHYEAALSREPKVAAAHFDLGLLYNKLGDSQKALGHYRMALELEPMMITAMINIADQLSKSGRNHEALPYLERAVALQPKGTLARYNLGIILAQLGRLSDAEAELRKVIILEPTGELAHLNLGLVLLGLGRENEAITYLQTALRIKPDLAPARNELQRIFRGRQLESALDNESTPLPFGP